MLSIRQARLSAATPADFPVADARPPQRAANDQRRAIDSRHVLAGCAILLSLIGIGSTLKALELRPQPGCIASPVRLMLNGQTHATIETRGGAACTIAVQTGSAIIDDLTVSSQPQHGTIVPRGRTGVVYRAHGKYRGEDSFELSLHGRTGTQEGFAVVRVQVNVQ